MILNLLFDFCIWQVEDRGVEVVHGAMVDRHRFLISMPSLRPWVLRLPLVHRLMHLEVREVLVTSRGSRHIILQHSQEDGTRW